MQFSACNPTKSTSAKLTRNRVPVYYVLAKLNPHLLTYHFRNFIVAVKEFLHSENEFVSFFMKASREHYGRLLFRDNTCDLRKHCDASVNHTVEGFVQEVRIVFSMY